MSDENTMFKLLRVYLKDVSFESPAAPEGFMIRAEPEVDMNLRVNVRALPGEAFEVVLAATITARAEGATLYLCEVQQAGLFQSHGHEPASLERRLHVHCPRQLFPFLREAVANLAMKGGFPPLVITPARFDQLYNANKPTAGA